MFTRASTARRIAVTCGCLFWIVLLGWEVQSGQAQIYSWRDEHGRLHFTDNPATIPPHLRPENRERAPASPSGAETAPQPPDEAAPAAARTVPAAEPVSALPAGQRARLERRASDLQEQIEAAQQERQQYLEQITAVRDVRTNPAFGRQRRRVDTWGRALAEVERRLDSLRHELQEVQSSLRQYEQAPQPALRPSPPSEDVVFDARGRTRDYWQQRARPLQTQLQQARERRQHILAELSAEPEGAFGRRGDEVLRLTRTLEDTEATIRQTEAALQQLRQEARAAGAPLAWLQE